MTPPPADFGPWSINVVGITTASPEVTEADGKWFEVIAPGDLAPRDLHRAQVERRLGK